MIIDLRPLAQYRSGHHPDALHLDFARALETFPTLDRGRTYVLTCEFGLLSAHLAEYMRREGFELAVSRPEVILHEEDGEMLEPWEQLTVDLDADSRVATGRFRG